MLMGMTFSITVYEPKQHERNQIVIGLMADQDYEFGFL